MVEVTALTGFDHGGRRRRGDTFEVSTQQARALKQRGLISFEDDESDPSNAAGEPSSASPADQASPQTTARGSGSGARRSRKTEA